MALAIVAAASVATHERGDAARQAQASSAVGDHSGVSAASQTGREAAGGGRSDIGARGYVDSEGGADAAMLGQHRESGPVQEPASVGALGYDGASVVPNAPLLGGGDVGSVCQGFTAWLSDELSGCLWHLDRDRSFDGRLGRTPVGGDINIGDVWTITKGGNVNVAVLDEVWNPDHHDIADNVDLARSNRYGLPAGEGRTGHGTRVAGVIAARDNEVGGRGVAPRATLFNYGVIPPGAFTIYSAYKENASDVAVFNLSVGDDQGPQWKWENDLTWDSLDVGMNQGFDGKGALYVFSAGNGRTTDTGSGQVNLQERHSHPAAVVVCAVDDDGDETSYSQIGSSLWVCAPSEGDAADDDNQLLAPAGDNGYSVFGRTSAAAPQVSGVVALVRSANPYLTWRDVKLILAGTAQKNDASDRGWTTGAVQYGSSSGRYSFNQKYGFGVVDASAAVDAALAWKRLPPQSTETVSSGALTSEIIPGVEVAGVRVPNDGTVIERTLEVPAASAVDFVEHLWVHVDVSSLYGRDLRIDLVSPSGAVSTLIEPIGSRDQCWGTWDSLRRHYQSGCAFPRAGAFGDPDAELQGFRFAANQFLGEDPAGTWRLRLSDSVLNPAGFPVAGDEFQQQARLLSWQLDFRGHSGASTDTAPRARLSVNGADSLDVTVGEGASVAVTATLAGGTLQESTTVPVSIVAGTASSADYSTSDLQITIPAGRRSASASFRITSDGVDERDETLSVAWRDPSQGTRPDSLLYLGDPVEVTIRGNLTPDSLLTLTFEASPVCVVEGGSVAVTGSLTGGTHSSEMAFPIEFVGGTATPPATQQSGADYSPVEVGGSLVTTLRVPAGSSSAAGSIEIIDDSRLEREETFEIALLRPPGLRDVARVAGSPATVTIIDNDGTSTTDPAACAARPVQPPPVQPPPVQPPPVQPPPPPPPPPVQPVGPDPAPVEDSFSDLAMAPAVHRTALEALVSAGAFNGLGCGGGALCPADAMLRWEMAVLLVRAVDGTDPGGRSGQRFADVDQGLWWAPHVERLAELGITVGCSTDPLSYCPDDPVSRAQMATFLVRAFEPAAAGSAGFADTEDSVHEAHIDALFAVGITAGCSADPLRYCPAASVTRAQMATFLQRASISRYDQ